VRYAVEDFIKEADTIQSTNETYYFGDWLKKSGKILKQASELHHTFNQSVLDGFIHIGDKFVKEEYPHVKGCKKHFDKMCASHDSVRNKLNTESGKKKIQEKKINDLTQDLSQQKKLKDTVKNSAVVEIEDLENNIYKKSVFALMDIMENLNKYFEEGVRLCKRAAQDVELGKEEFNKHLEDRSQGKIPSLVNPKISQDFAQSAPVVNAVDAPVAGKKKEKLSRSSKIVQNHKQRYNKDLANCKDPSLAVLLKAIYEENVYQQNIGDIVKLFQEPLEQDPNWNTKVSEEEREGIFSNIKDIQKMHLEIHGTYRDCQQNFPSKSVCSVLENAISQFSIYVPFLCNFNAADARIEHLAKRSKQFQSFLFTPDVSLQELMEYPTIVFGTYEALLEQADEQAKSEDDKVSLKKAKAAIEDYKNSISGNETDKASVAQLLEVQEQLIDFTGQSLDAVPERRFIRGGKVTVQIDSVDEDSASPKGRHQLYLCNDIIICTKKAPKAEGKKKFKLVAISKLLQTSIKACDDKNILKLQEQLAKDIELTYTLFLSSKEDKEWRKAIEDAITKARQHRVIGIPLEELMQSEREKGNLVPSLVEQCTHVLVSTGALKKEGLIRVSANASEILALTQRINSGRLVSMEGVDAHSIVCILKKFFRDMPDPVFTHKQFPFFLEAYALEDPDEKLIEMQVLLEELPEPNQFLLQHIFSFFSLLASYSEENKMNSQNIAVVMAPIMLNPPSLDASSMAKQNDTIDIIRYIIDNAKELFANIKDKRQQIGA